MHPSLYVPGKNIYLHALTNVPAADIRYLDDGGARFRDRHGMGAIVAKA